MIIKLLEFSRIALTGVGIFLAYYFGDTPEEVLHIIAPFVITAIAGLSGIEGLFFSKSASTAAGFESGSNYQRQSAFAFLTLGIMALIVYFLDWGTMAELTLSLTFLILFTLSAINHTWQIIVKKNNHWKNLNRPFLTAMLIVAFWWPVFGSL